MMGMAKRQNGIIGQRVVQRGAHFFLVDQIRLRKSERIDIELFEWKTARNASKTPLSFR